MATANPNMFYARPVFVPNASQDSSRQSLQNKESRVPVSKMADTSPPPRPPPPRPPKKSSYIQNSVQLKDQIGSHSSGLSSRSHMVQPLTQYNMVNHDRFWELDFEPQTTEGEDVLSPPLKHITPAMTEEMWKNYDPLDVVDSTSDRSDSSVDTMIMMTTDEEKRNSERINLSLQKYTSLKTKGEIVNTNKLKNDIQNKSLHLHIPEQKGINVPRRNGIIVPGDRSHDPSPDLDSNKASKMSPLHISTGNHNTNFSPVGKATGTQPFSNADSPDDGYGTNSSSGTISSPCSSSFNSVITEFDSSYGSVKKVVLPNGAIKPNSVRESWAVRRKQRMIESEDNTVQEQLRQLTIIQEETSEPRASGHQDNSNHDDYRTGDKNVSGLKQVATKSNGKEMFGSCNGDVHRNQNQTSNTSTPFINVSQSDIEHRNRQLYVIEGDHSGDTPATSYGNYNQQKPQVNIETSTREPELRSRSRSGKRLSSSGTIGGANVHENTHNYNSDVPDYNSTGYPNSYGNYAHENARNYVSDVQDYNSMEYPNSYGSDRRTNSGRFNVEVPPLLRGGSDTNQHTLSGRIYVSDSGDEGMYSLNRSSRSTSVSSFQPITDQSQAPSSPQSPIEKLSGELLEKWTDMDRNYRNYYGFQEQEKNWGRTDSKVNYFQKKKINNQVYDQDNVYSSQPTLAGTLTGSLTNSTGNLDRRSIAPESGRVEQHLRREEKSSHDTSNPHKGDKKDSTGNTKSKLFQILPNMFRPSSKKQNGENRSNGKGKRTKSSPIVEIVPTEPPRPKSVDFEPESEYVNLGDLPQYSLAHVKFEEKLRQGEKVSIESLITRPVFASSKDITKLFSKKNMSFDSMTNASNQRHSFHAMPNAYKHLLPYSGEFDDDMRPRAQSTSATMNTRHSKHMVDSRMAVLAQKNLSGINQVQLSQEDSRSAGNISVHSNTSSQHRPGSRPRSRLDSGSSNGESKLSTLV